MSRGFSEGKDTLVKRLDSVAGLENNTKALKWQLK